MGLKPLSPSSNGSIVHLYYLGLPRSFVDLRLYIFFNKFLSSSLFWGVFHHSESLPDAHLLMVLATYWVIVLLLLLCCSCLDLFLLLHLHTVKNFAGTQDSNRICALKMKPASIPEKNIDYLSVVICLKFVYTSKLLCQNLIWSNFFFVILFRIFQYSSMLEFITNALE